MNKIYDKLLLALAVLLLLAGVGFYVMNLGNLPSSKPQISVQPADNPYQSIPVPEFSETEANWPEAEPQSTGWRYDVFTPPKIYIGDDGRFTIEPWEVAGPVEPPAPFGIYLVSVSRDPYRIQLEGYIEEDRDDPSKNLALFFDEERQRGVRARAGDERPASDFKLLDFTVERIRASESEIGRVARATILDQRTGSEIVLVDNERRLEDTVTVIFRSEEDPDVEIKLTEAGQSFETPSGEYVLEEIYLEESSVKVKKLGDESLEREPESRILDARGERAAPRTQSPQPTPQTNQSTENTGDAGATESDDEAFDFMF